MSSDRPLNYLLEISVIRHAKKKAGAMAPASPETIAVRLSLESALAPGRIQLFLAQTDRARSDLHQLIVSDEFQCLLQGQEAGRGELDSVVGAGCTHVGQLLALAGVDFQVIVLVVLTNDHAAVYLDSGPGAKDA